MSLLPRLLIATVLAGFSARCAWILAVVPARGNGFGAAAMGFCALAAAAAALAVVKGGKLSADPPLPPIDPTPAVPPQPTPTVPIAPALAPRGMVVGQWMDGPFGSGFYCVEADPPAESAEAAGASEEPPLAVRWEDVSAFLRLEPEPGEDPMAFLHRSGRAFAEARAEGRLVPLGIHPRPGA